MSHRTAHWAFTLHIYTKVKAIEFNCPSDQNISGQRETETEFNSQFLGQRLLLFLKANLCFAFILLYLLWLAISLQCHGLWYFTSPAAYRETCASAQGAIKVIHVASCRFNIWQLNIGGKLSSPPNPVGAGGWSFFQPHTGCSSYMLTPK